MGAEQKAPLKIILPQVWHSRRRPGLFCGRLLSPNLNIESAPSITSNSGDQDKLLTAWKSTTVLGPIVSFYWIDARGPLIMISVGPSQSFRLATIPVQSAPLGRCHADATIHILRYSSRNRYESYAGRRDLGTHGVVPFGSDSIGWNGDVKAI